MTLSSDVKPKRILHLFLKEPIPGQVKPTMVEELGSHTQHTDGPSLEACKRYQAQVTVLLEQLLGLEDTKLRIFYTPADAYDAIRFWLLPQLDGTINVLPSPQADNNPSFLFTPKCSSSPIEIDFRPQPNISPNAGLSSAEQTAERVSIAQQIAIKEGFETIATIGSNTPECGSRWINLAMVMCEKSLNKVEGLSPQSKHYLSVIPAESKSDQSTQLPPLSKIKTDKDWINALDSALGAKLKKARKSLD